MWWSLFHNEEVSTDAVPTDLENILQQFQQVFKDTIQLPPERSQ
ncbi:hypothetical protein A2U01_0089830, partial [Trifolium medium]|nr:hypothetical protein [Trifolium medium]